MTVMRKGSLRGFSPRKALADTVRDNLQDENGANASVSNVSFQCQTERMRSIFEENARIEACATCAIPARGSREEGDKRGCWVESPGA